jgi:hypothetical protein
MAGLNDDPGQAKNLWLEQPDQVRLCTDLLEKADGQPVFRVFPPGEQTYDAARLKEAILRRRDESWAEMEAWAF